MKGLRKTFLKNYHGLFAYISPNCYMRINYAINVNKTIIKIAITKRNLIFTSLKNILL